MASSVFLAAVAVAFGGCAVEPSYEGRRCNAERACPREYECGSDGRCHVQGSLRPDAGSTPEDAGATDAPSEDAGGDAGEDAGKLDVGARDSEPDDAGPALISIAVAPESLSLVAGFERQLSAEALFDDQSTRDVSAEASWSSVDPAVASIEPGGLLRALAPGTTIVRATFGGVTGSAALSVTPAIAVQVDTYNKHNLVVKSDGTLWGWGWNEHRQLDPIAENQIATPRRLAIDDVAWARACGTMTFAVKRDGSVWSWGGNGGGELGNGDIGPVFVDAPAPVLGPLGAGALSGVLDLRCGYNFALALLPDRTVLAWGANSFGSLGLGGASNPATPVPTPIPGLGNVEAIAAGTYHGVALLGGGSVVAWGYNEYGQLGSGAFGVHTNAPNPVVGIAGAGQLANILQIDAGWGHTLALTSDRRAIAFGWNASGQLGDTTNADRIEPAFVLSQGAAELSGVAQVSAGFTHSYARLEDGTLVAWGFNGFGQLGDDTQDDRSAAAPVRSAAGPPFAGTSAFSGGGDHAIVLTVNDEVFVFGSNVNAELGNGTFGAGLFVGTPVPVSGL